MTNTMTAALDKATNSTTAFSSFAGLEAACAAGYVPTLARAAQGSLGAALEARGYRVFWRW